jgi:hypothetical protein
MATGASVDTTYEGMTMIVEFTEREAAAVRIGLVMMMHDPNPMGPKWMKAASTAFEKMHPSTSEDDND